MRIWNLEIICVDDGSKDRSLEILREYKARDNRIIVIAQTNGGVSSARNAGLDRMTGDFVFFLDSDDFIHPQTFALLLKAQQDSVADLVIARLTSVKAPTALEYPRFSYSDSKWTLKSPLGIVKQHYLSSYCCGRLFRAEQIHAHRFQEAFSYSEDTLFNAELMEKTPDLRICVLDYPLYYYLRPDSVTNLVEAERRAAFTEYCLKRSNGKAAEIPFFVLSVFRISRFMDHYHARPAERRQFIRLLRRCLPRIWLSRHFSLKEKLRYAFMSCFPKLEYRRRV